MDQSKKCPSCKCFKLPNYYSINKSTGRDYLSCNICRKRQKHIRDMAKVRQSIKLADGRDYAMQLLKDDIIADMAKMGIGQ